MDHRQALEEQTDSERLRQFFQRAARSLPGSVYPAVVLWGYFYWLTGSRDCLVWAAMIHSWQALRYYLSWRYPVWKLAVPVMREAEGWTVHQLALAGVIWGLAPWMLMPSGQGLEHLSVVLLMVLGNMSASASALAFSARVGTAHFCAVAAVMMTWLFWQRSVEGAVLGVTFGVFTASLLILFRSHHGYLVQAIRSRIELGLQTQQLAEQNELLERLRQERDRLYATASHDLRQPVQALDLQAQTLEVALAGSPHAAAARRIGDVAQSVGRALGSMLELHQFDSASTRSRVEPVSLESLLFEASQLWADIAARRQLRLRFHGRNVHVMAPKVLLQRLLNNLIDNALKFTARGGVLVGVRLRERQGRLWVRLEVWDTGVGIVPEEESRVFQHFFRGRLPDGFASPQGLGLGLSAIRKVCDEQGWTVGMRSRPGRGTVFFCEIPRMNGDSALRG